ncbi:MAG: D-serine ammonia-lyase, partial [Atopostipes suicloacalis]|nr:D-serine ammonia-lyase [Atopostipes suicloacalis]
DNLLDVMWFRRDLRIEDNIALSEALSNSDSLLLLFHVNPEQFVKGESKNEAAFFQRVKRFKREIELAGGKIHFLYGDLKKSLQKLKERSPEWSSIYLNYDETGYGLKRDQMIAPLFKELDIKVHAFHDHYLHSAQEIKTNAGTAYKVYTPYYNKWIKRMKASPVQVNFDDAKIIKNELFKEDYKKFASDKFRAFFSNYELAVGTTGNLGISVGAMGRALGFQVTVHMSEEAKDWKKDFLRNRGVEVIEHKTNFTKAVEEGRKASNANPRSYFIDDEHSVDLFLGYTVGGYRMKKQLANEGIQVDAEHPLFVYLPCGIGGSPSGITFGLKHAFGDHVHCFFAEPTKMPSMIAGLASQKYDQIEVKELNLGGVTVADGLAVPRTSALVAKLMNHYFSGGYTLKDRSFQILLTKLFESEEIFLEPAAVAGLAGPFKLLSTEKGKKYLEKYQLGSQLKNATHIAWATGGSMVPTDEQLNFIREGKGKDLRKG